MCRTGQALLLSTRCLSGSCSSGSRWASCAWLSARPSASDGAGTSSACAVRRTCPDGLSPPILWLTSPRPMTWFSTKRGLFVSRSIGSSEPGWRANRGCGQTATWSTTGPAAQISLRSWGGPLGGKRSSGRTLCTLAWRPSLAMPLLFSPAPRSEGCESAQQQTAHCYSSIDRGPEADGGAQTVLVGPRLDQSLIGDDTHAPRCPR